MIPNNERLRVAVIGGGIAGLSAAWWLRSIMREAGRRHELVVYEQQDVCGGAARTTNVAGLSLEHGPNGWLSGEPLMARLIAELGLTPQLCQADAAAKNRFLFTGGRLHRVPTTPGQFLKTALLGPAEKLRVGMEYFVPRRSDDADETIFEFGCRRLGRGFTDTLLDPMVSGVFAGDIRRLSLPATFPVMRSMEREYGGLFRALFSRRRSARQRDGRMHDEPARGGPAGPSGTLTTLQGGVGLLTQTLANRLQPHIRRHCEVTAVAHEHDRFVVQARGRAEGFDAVVMAVPAWRAGAIVEPLDRKLAETLRDIPFAGVTVVCHAYPENVLSARLSGFGYLIPRRDRIRALGCLWTSSIFPHQAPPGTVLLRTIFGGAHDPDVLALPDERLQELAADVTRAALGLHAPPVHCRIFRHPLGIAQYTLGHRERIAQIDRVCDALPGLAFVGASYRGVSLNRCVRDAGTVAPRVLVPFGLHTDPGD